MVKNGESINLGQIEVIASNDRVHFQLISRSGVVMITFDRKESAQIVKELNEWLRAN